METVALKDTSHLSGYSRELRESLNEYANLKEDWDYEGAEPICKEVIKNVSDILDVADEETLKYWSLSPASNSTLTFQHEKQKAVISIGMEEYSYILYENGKLIKHGDHLPMSVHDITQIMRDANKAQF